MERSFAACTWLLLACAIPTASCSIAPRSSSTTLDARGRASVAFQPWTRATFERAAREHKYLLVSVQTEWCHWCHVMNDVTYHDAEVTQLLAERFVVVRVDADARPDVAERYQRWGWPATGLLTPDAQPILNLRGYQEPRAFAKLLATVAAGGGRETIEALARRTPASADELPALRDLARAQLDAQWDDEQSGWGTPQKYPRTAPVEHAFWLAAVEHDQTRRARALAALERYATLIDPVWGGMYQYSVGGDWWHPHYEKVHTVQAGALASFVQAYRVTGDRRWLARAHEIVRFLTERFRDSSGAFYANQDADVGRPGDADHELGEKFYARSAEQREGMRAPSIDQHVYANTNGLSIAALCALYEATADGTALAAAQRAYEAIEATHRSGVLYAHAAPATTDLSAADGGRSYFTDDVEMARALFALHQATADAKYEARLRELVQATIATFEDHEHGGFFTHTPDPEAVGAWCRRPRATTRIPASPSPTCARAIRARYPSAIQRRSAQGSRRRWPRRNDSRSRSLVR